MSREVEVAGMGWLLLWTCLTFVNTCSVASKDDIRELRDAIKALEAKP